MGYGFYRYTIGVHYWGKYTILKLKVNDLSTDTIRSAKIRSSDFEIINSAENILSKRLLHELEVSEDRILRAINSDNRIFPANDRILAFKIVYFEQYTLAFGYFQQMIVFVQSRSYTFSQDRIHSVMIVALKS